jgi:integrase/recombinase XerD
MQVVTATDTIDQYISEMKREINPSEAYERLTRFVLSKIDVMTTTQEDIVKYLDTIRKPEREDPLHKWIGTYNLYIIILKRFFKWLNDPYCMEGVRKLKRKERSIYKPTDLWTQEEDLIFLKYCPSKRDKCYHAMSRDSSCRPSEILRLRVKDVVFKNLDGRQYAEILVNGKTGSRHIPLINSIPYLKDWLDDHPGRENPNSYLIRSAKTFGKLNSTSVNATYARYKEKYFPKLLKDRDLNSVDRNAITELLRKPWNPYIRRHSALTDKSKILKEHILRQHAGWSSRSNMPEKYLHFFGNESSESILEAYGLKPKEEQIATLRLKECPNCSEPNQVNAKFCRKCRMILSYDEYTEVTQERESYETRLKAMEQTQREILECLKHPEKLVQIAQSED